MIESLSLVLVHVKVKPSVFTVRDLAPLSSRWSRPASEKNLRRPRARLAPSPLSSPLLHFLFFPSILSLIQVQSPPPPPPPLISHHLPLGASHFLTLLCVPRLPSLCPPSSPVFLFLCVAECQRGEKAMRRSQITVGRGEGG